MRDTRKFKKIVFKQFSEIPFLIFGAENLISNQ